MSIEKAPQFQYNVDVADDLQAADTHVLSARFAYAEAHQSEATLNLSLGKGKLMFRAVDRILEDINELLDVGLENMKTGNGYLYSAKSFAAHNRVPNASTGFTPHRVNVINRVYQSPVTRGRIAFDARRNCNTTDTPTSVTSFVTIYGTVRDGSQLVIVLRIQSQPIDTKLLQANRDNDLDDDDYYYQDSSRTGTAIQLTVAGEGSSQDTVNLAGKLSEAFEGWSRFYPDVEQGGAVSIIESTQRGFQLREFKVRNVSSDVTHHYNDDFEDVHNTILRRLTETDKGIVLLHGAPGTGKTSYIRLLANKVPTKRFMLLSAELVQSISSPNFIQFLASNPGSVLLIEDAEEIVANRGDFVGRTAGISNLLNVGDGLIGDAIQCQIICSFNTDIENIDPALLRDGRLIAQYEFRPLAKQRANDLYRHLSGHDDRPFDCDTPVASVYAEVENRKAIKAKKAEKRGIGFTASF